MTRIDLVRALALGELTAKSELEKALKQWLAKPNSAHPVERLEKELENLLKPPL
jgi:hypothetical protein